jgi:hypothetical protein
MSAQESKTHENGGARAEGHSATIFYHGGCPDGIAAAWAVWHGLPHQVKICNLSGVYVDGRGDAIAPLDQLRDPAYGGTVVHGLVHGAPRPEVELVRDRDVDILPKPEIVTWVAAQAKTLTVIDHHASEKSTILMLAEMAKTEEFQSQIRIRYAEDKSAAQLAWDYTYTVGLTTTRIQIGVTESPQGSRPLIIDYIADRDLYKFALPDSRAVSKALHTDRLARGFCQLIELVKWTASDFKLIAERGKCYLEVENRTIATIAKGARAAKVRAVNPADPAGVEREYGALVVNTPVMASDVGDYIMRELATPEVDFAAMWSYAPDEDELWVSLRTTRHSVPLDQLSKQIVGAVRGGGHPRAAGLTIPGRDITRVFEFTSQLAKRRAAFEAEAKKATGSAADGHVPAIGDGGSESAGEKRARLEAAEAKKAADGNSAEAVAAGAAAGTTAIAKSETAKLRPTSTQEHAEMLQRRDDLVETAVATAAAGYQALAAARQM